MAKILVVDDQSCMRDLISEELTQDGHEVQGAGDAESARQRLRISPPDLVLLDLYLDGPEGFGLLQDIKSQYPRLPVIVVTAYDTYREDPRLSQANGYVIKRIEFWGELKRIVAAVLGEGLTVGTWGEREGVSYHYHKRSELDASQIGYPGCSA